MPLGDDATVPECVQICHVIGSNVVGTQTIDDNNQISMLTNVVLALRREMRSTNACQ